uniref:Adenosine receptor A1-like n=1 Tax=Crassostrea virginica TaxID=6565 RepID=A0A8B8BJ43_CRAVI|nr:adenosine receptor A1-like [Crassostrea virginica]
MVVTIDRYIAIVFPFRYEQYVTTRSTIITIASVWIFSEVYSIAVHVIYPPKSEFQICRYEDMYNLIQTLLLNIGTGVIPLVVMISLYIQVIKVVRKQTRSIATQFVSVSSGSSSDQANSRKDPRRKENRSTALISLLLLFYFTAWCPIVAYFLYVLLSKRTPSAYVGATCRIIVFTNSCVNVFVYSLRLQNFRKYMMKDLRHCCEIFRKCLQSKRKGFQIHSSQCEETSTSITNNMYSSHTKEEDISIVNI